MRRPSVDCAVMPMRPSKPALKKPCRHSSRETSPEPSASRVPKSASCSSASRGELQKKPRSSSLETDPLWSASMQSKITSGDVQSL